MQHIKASDLTVDFLTTHMVGIPIMLCSATPRLIKKLEAGYKEFNLNKELSKALLKVSS